MKPDEIEVTSEMIEAGDTAYIEHGPNPIEIYRAMEAARRKAPTCSPELASIVTDKG